LGEEPIGSNLSNPGRRENAATGGQASESAILPLIDDVRADGSRNLADCRVHPPTGESK